MILRTQRRLKDSRLWVSCLFQTGVSDWLYCDGFTHTEDLTLMCRTVPTRSAKQHQRLPVACSWTNVFIRLIVCVRAPFCLSCKWCKQVLTCQPARCHMPLCHDLLNSCPHCHCVCVCVCMGVGVGGWVCVCDYICVYCKGYKWLQVKHWPQIMCKAKDKQIERAKNKKGALW